MNIPLVYSVSDFVAVCNQLLDISFGRVTVTGELSQFKISKNRWVYFDLKDELSSVRFFGSVFNLPGPLEDGMLLEVTGTPQLHPKFGFSVTVSSISLSGEGTIKKAATLLEQKLDKEGLFRQERKRPLPYPPSVVGLITSAESAAYADFIKVVNQRWAGLEIQLFDVHVQGEKAPQELVRAIEYFNNSPNLPEVLVVIRGGGSAEDLQAFNTESVTRAVASSRIPTLVAIGHETDISLAEKAADRRASTPSNAAELLTPDKSDQKRALSTAIGQCQKLIRGAVQENQQVLNTMKMDISVAMNRSFSEEQFRHSQRQQRLNILSPQNVLRRGYALVRSDGAMVQSVKSVKEQAVLDVTLRDGTLHTKVISKELS